MIEPLPALAAVLVVGLALGLYADTLATVEPGSRERPTASAVLQSVHDAVTDDGAARPDRVPGSQVAGPNGYDVNVTLVVGSREWAAGPTPPEGTAARRPTSVQLDRWTVRPGTLRVVVWT